MEKNLAFAKQGSLLIEKKNTELEQMHRKMENNVRFFMNSLESWNQKTGLLVYYLKIDQDNFAINKMQQIISEDQKLRKFFMNY